MIAALQGTPHSIGFIHNIYGDGKSSLSQVGPWQSPSLQLPCSCLTGTLQILTTSRLTILGPLAGMNAMHAEPPRPQSIHTDHAPGRPFARRDNIPLGPVHLRQQYYSKGCTGSGTEGVTGNNEV